MTYVTDGQEVTKLRVHAECLLPEEDVRWIKAAAKSEGIPLRAMTSRLLQEIVVARMEDMRRASLPSDQERERAMADAERLEEALEIAARITPRKGSQRVEQWLREQIAFARLIAGGQAAPLPRNRGDR